MVDASVVVMNSSDVGDNAVQKYLLRATQVLHYRCQQAILKVKMIQNH